MSLINSVPQHIKFISYTGKYPNLCGGILTLEIDGVEHRFGHDYRKYESWKNDGNHEAFWVSGGHCGFTNDRSDFYIKEGSWIIDASRLPENLKVYAAEIDEIFNSNVAFGCCGGCL